MKKGLILFIAAFVTATVLSFFFLGEDETPQVPSLPIEDNAAVTEVPIEEVTVSSVEEEVSVEEAVVVSENEESTEVEIEAVPETNKANTCFISVKCDTILNNKELLPEEKWELVPADGKILAEREVSFRKDESAFDILLRVLKEERIHIEFMTTPIYDSVYIEGIGNIYEMDCGKLSGWMYKVNGAFLQTSSSAYMPENGDKIEWVYTCDAGKDVSAESVTE